MPGQQTVHILPRKHRQLAHLNMLKANFLFCFCFPTMRTMFQLLDVCGHVQYRSLIPFNMCTPAQKRVTVSTDITVRGGAAQHNKSTSTPFSLRFHRRGKWAQRTAGAGQMHRCFAAQQGKKQVSKFKTCQSARGIRSDTRCGLYVSKSQQLSSIVSKFSSKAMV